MGNKKSKSIKSANTSNNQIKESIETKCKQFTLTDYSILVTGYMKYSKPFILITVPIDIISLCSTFISFLDTNILNRQNELDFYNCIINGTKKNESIPSVNKLNIKLLYRGTIDGFNGFSMYDKCENESHLIFLVKSTNKHIFGGYTSLKLCKKNCSGHLRDKFAFMFSIYPNPNIYPVVKESKGYQVTFRRDEMFSYFGEAYGGMALMLWEDCNENWKSYCGQNANSEWKNFDAEKIVGDYKLTHGSGYYCFKVEEFEVFSLQF